MTRALTPRLSILVFAALVTCAATAAAQDRVVRQFGAGSGMDAVGIYNPGEDVEDAEIEGPQSLASGKGGELYVLDQNNGRIVSFEPHKAAGLTRSLEVPASIKPTDLVVVDDNLFLWDNGPQAVSASGPPEALVRSLTVSRSAAAAVGLAEGAFAQMGSTQLETPEDLLNPSRAAKPARKLEIPTRGLGPVTLDVAVPDAATGRVTLTPRDGAPATTLRFKVRDRLGTVDLLDVDTTRRTFLLVENVPTTSDRAAGAVVARFSARGELEGTYELPLWDSVSLSRRFITVTPDGTVYFLKTRSAAVDVVELGFRPLQANAAIDAWSVPAPDLKALRGKAVNAAVRRPTRRDVVTTALAFESFRWRVTPEVYGGDPDTACSGFRRVRRPGYLTGRLGQEVQGVPYCWGCHGNLSLISRRIARGELAGNVCTRDTPRPDVVGVDCSAFVSAAWGLSAHFTTLAIPSIATPIDNPWDLQPGDALNKPGSHVVLFLRFTPDRKIEVIESSTGRCNGRVCRNVYPLSSMLARGYVPVRYRGLATAEVADGGQPAAVAAPARASAGKPVKP